jgi:hypothetical protein
MSYKTAFVLCHKMREAMAVELKGRTIGEPGKLSKVGGYIKLANMRATAPIAASARTNPVSARP